jgi:hypothetical protein
MTCRLVTSTGLEEIFETVHWHEVAKIAHQILKAKPDELWAKVEDIHGEVLFTARP